MRQYPIFGQPLNYALVLLLLSLLVYSSIGLTLTVSPAQAEELPVREEPALAPLIADESALIVSSISQSP